jgi:hypothetical protein
LILTAVLLTGCATTSGVLKSGPDTYTVTASASLGGGGSSAAKKSAYEQANAECSKSGTSIDIVTERAAAPTWTDGRSSVQVP